MASKSSKTSSSTKLSKNTNTSKDTSSTKSTSMKKSTSSTKRKTNLNVQSKANGVKVKHNTVNRTPVFKYIQNGKSKKISFKPPKIESDFDPSWDEGKSFTPAGPERMKPGISKQMQKEINYNLNRMWGPHAYSKVLTNFDRLYSVYPEHELTNLYQYVIFTRPDMNIVDDGGDLVDGAAIRKKNAAALGPSSSPAEDSWFRFMYQNYPDILMNLTGRIGDRSWNHEFIPFLVGKTESLNLGDFTLKTQSLTQPYSGYTIPYAVHGTESRSGGSFEVTFREDEDLSIHKLFQTWVIYIHNLMLNIFPASERGIKYNIWDYFCSVYTITCKADATTIVHWAKYTGAFPTGVPMSDFSFNLRGGANNKVTIPFEYFDQGTPMDPAILVDFNRNAGLKDDDDPKYIKYMDLYQKVTMKDVGFKDPRRPEQKKIKSLGTKMDFSAPIAMGSGNGLVGPPFIVFDEASGHYLLRWREPQGINSVMIANMSVPGTDNN